MASFSYWTFPQLERGLKISPIFSCRCHMNQGSAKSVQGVVGWIVLGFVGGWLCRGGGGVVSMVAVFGGGG